MNIVLLTPIRLFGDGLQQCLGRHVDIDCTGVVSNLGELRLHLEREPVQLAIIDVTQGLDLDEIRQLAVEWPQLRLVALGLREQHQDVIRCGRAGFSGYVLRDASLDDFYQALSNAVDGHLSCSPEISGGLLRALFRADPPHAATAQMDALTRREEEVLHLIGRGLSNKEIARELVLSLATVKHHVHNLLSKMGLQRRAQAMRHVRDAPWLAPPSVRRQDPTRLAG